MCVRKNCVSAILGAFFICVQSIAAFGKGDEKTAKSPDTPSGAAPITFQWIDHKKLSWEDFRGAITSDADEVAAATHCGIGFKTTTPAAGGKPEIFVYNLFYTTRSWVKPDARIPGILEHEQGHFDLCEIYTRKLRALISKVDINAGNIKPALMAIYNDVSNEYERRQQAYEQETIHGTNLSAQKKWQETIARELKTEGTAALSAS